MAKIPGTNIAAPIVPFTTDDRIPTTEDIFLKGGHRTVATIAERDAIYPERRKEGMLCTVVGDHWKLYQLRGGIANTNWVETKAVYQFDITADGAASEFTITHNLGRQNLQISFVDVTAGPNKPIQVDWESISNDAIKLIPVVVLADGRIIRTLIS